MNINSTEFIKGIVEADHLLDDGRPQIAFIGRSNVGKSSTINTLTKKKDLARTSAVPGRTREINLFLINNSFYLLDLPGYGFIKTSEEVGKRLHKLVDWYLFNTHYTQKVVVLIIDASVGIMDNDLEMMAALDGHGKNVVILANKVDRIKNSEYSRRLKFIQEKVGSHKVIPFSAKKKIGVGALVNEILG
jgi:GTP-binding protein